MGGEWTLRRLEAEDREAIAAHLHALSPGARYTRFGHLFPDTHLDTLVAALDFDTDLFCGVITPDLRLVALVQAAPEQGLPGVAELAFTVIPAFQGNGLARLLGERMFRMLPAQGMDRAQVRFLASNLPMRGLARALTFDCRPDGLCMVGTRPLRVRDTPRTSASPFTLK